MMLSPGGYQLSEKNGACKKKSMVFVKLTDSALRALNQYIEYQDKIKNTLTIEFNNNEGKICIPALGKSSVASEKSMAQFKFNVDSNVAMEGQQGRFECIQQKNRSEKLIRFGQLTKRLRIHANEDIYETTKNRMAAIELEQRKNCTVQIDLNSTTVNRKVKVDRNSKISSSSTKSENSEKLNINPVMKTTAPKTRNSPKVCNPNLMKKSLRERILHMLAVKPYKKIELLAALRKDGLRESDKAHVTSTLTSVASVKENLYHLMRHVWNDVQEDWPFYNELEKQKMKRNKSQNFTPPVTDFNVSVTSNQSPDNAGDKSPSCQYKRPGYFNGVDGFQTKRLRISHIKQNTKPVPSIVNEENAYQISPCQITNCFDEVIEKSGLCNTAVKNIPLKKFRQNTTKPVIRNDFTNRPSPEMQSDVVSSTDDKSNDVRDQDIPQIIPHSDVYKNETQINSVKKEVKTELCDNFNNAQLCLEKYSNDNVGSYFINTHTTEQNENDGPLLVSPDIPDVKACNDCSMPHYFKSPCSVDKIDYVKKYVTVIDLAQRAQYKTDFRYFFREYQEKVAAINRNIDIIHDLKIALTNEERESPRFKQLNTEICHQCDVFKVQMDQEIKHFYYLHDMLSHIKLLVEEFDHKV